MEIGVFGLGATGGLFATHLAQQNRLHVLARGTRGAHALTSGLRVTGIAELEVPLPPERVHLLDAPDVGSPSLALDALLRLLLPLLALPLLHVGLPLTRTLHCWGSHELLHLCYRYRLQRERRIKNCE